MRLISLLAFSLLITGCTMMQSKPSFDFKQVTSATWQLESINDKPAMEPTRSRLVFDAGTGRLSGRSCNSFFGSYDREKTGADQESGMLTIKIGGTTRMACKSNLMQEEQKLFTQLEHTRRFEIRGNKLYLFGNDGEVLIYSKKK
ncbi:META domain-containing protein [Spongorhabdus nitratireducens]